MYNHAQIKQQGKDLTKATSNTIIVSLIVSLLGGGAAGGSSFNFTGNGSSSSSGGSYDETTAEFMSGLLVAMAGILIVIGLIAIAYSIFIAGPVQIGGAGWFRRATKWKERTMFMEPKEKFQNPAPKVGSIFAPFKNGYFMSSVGTVLLVSVYTFLWSLLCFIPGIIKGYSYSMTNYIKSENPDLSAKQCIEMSQIMTDGHKADLFYLDLSFIGWELLGLCTCGILNIVYVNPWMMASKAYAYEALKEEAISLGKLDAQSFVCMGTGFYPDEADQ